MRNIINLFTFKKIYNYEIINIGSVLLFITKYVDLNQLKALVNYSIVGGVILIILDNLNEIFMIHESIFDICEQYIIIYLD